jgi:hypothetical protein
MDKETGQVRIPELPVFKKYSLAVRQEFAGADEILAILERTTDRIHVLVAREEEARKRKAEAEPEEAPNPRAHRRAPAKQKSRPASAGRKSAMPRKSSGRKKPVKAKKPAIEIVHVGHKGKPIKAGAAKKPAKSLRKPASKKPSRKR